MLFDTELTHEGERHSPFMELCVADDAPLPATDWVQTLLDHRAVRNLEGFMEVDDPRPEMPLLIAFDSEDLKERDGFVLFGVEGEDPFEGLPDGGEVDDITVPGNPDYDDPYDDWWETGGSAGGEGGGPSGDGGGGGEGDIDAPAPDVPRDLSRKSCSELAYYEHRVDSDIRNSRGIVTTLLSALDPFQSNQIFDEIWSAFDRAYNQPGIDRIDPSFDLLQIWSDTRDPNSLISTSLRSMGVAMGAEIVLFAAFDRLYQATLDKARIDAAQSTKGCSG